MGKVILKLFVIILCITKKRFSPYRPYCSHVLSPSQLQHYYHCFHNKVVEEHILFNAFVSCLTLGRQICRKRRVTPFRQILAGHPVPHGDLL